MRSNLLSQKGQSTVEYGLLLCLLALVVIAGIMLFGSTLQNSYEHSSTEIHKINAR
ncbi:MAG TPA: hypothetical protein VEC37_16945 [Bacillota bacterium]|nr:hypothetical protein [Bacillota bacterium]